MLLELGFGELEFLRGYLEKVRSCVWEYFFLSLSMKNNSSASSKRISSRVSRFGSSSSTEFISREVGQGSKAVSCAENINILLKPRYGSGWQVTLRVFVGIFMIAAKEFTRLTEKWDTALAPQMDWPLILGSRMNKSVGGATKQSRRGNVGKWYLRSERTGRYFPRLSFLKLRISVSLFSGILPHDLRGSTYRVLVKIVKLTQYQDPFWFIILSNNV